MVHRALWGSVERFFGVLIEHYAGAFPAWLAPVQATVLPVSGKFSEYAQKVVAATKGCRLPRPSRRSQRKAASQNSRRPAPKNSLHADHRRQGSGSRHRLRSPPLQGRPGPRPLDQFIADLKAEIDSKAVVLTLARSARKLARQLRQAFQHAHGSPPAAHERRIRLSRRSAPLNSAPYNANDASPSKIRHCDASPHAPRLVRHAILHAPAVALLRETPIVLGDELLRAAFRG